MYLNALPIIPAFPAPLPLSPSCSSRTDIATTTLSHCNVSSANSITRSTLLLNSPSRNFFTFCSWISTRTSHAVPITRPASPYPSSYHPLSVPVCFYSADPPVSHFFFAALCAVFIILLPSPPRFYPVHFFASVAFPPYCSSPPVGYIRNTIRISCPSYSNTFRWDCSMSCIYNTRLPGSQYRSLHTTFPHCLLRPHFLQASSRRIAH
ncbi:hypothetical protein AX774_g7711 [Zancudomyces culisetae]|uniref:Uncharacterized protein n=1 Tax=Zancudomyces culisetae TaxID=1213189 RepID=A0A1R1PD79_ZANCU|nr:hypothetical protein AX774_g7711 [Zancudomyces culisetae]|eukprot:OMH78891.1 hypothetical protein AX774_g7711 [Zancudomyces culisetae]